MIALPTIEKRYVLVEAVEVTQVKGKPQLRDDGQG